MMNATTEVGGKATTRRVLVVDDDRDLADSIVDILEAHGYEPVQAYSIQDTIGLMEEFRPDVGLLDIRLRDGSGIELLPKLKRANPDILCVMMTGYAAADTAIGALRCGAHDYLHKPVSSEDLFTTLDRCFATIELRREKEVAEAALSERNHQLESINERLHRVVEATSALTAFTRLKELGPRLLEEFGHNMSAQGGSLYLCTESGLELLHSLDPNHAPTTIPLPLRADSVFARALADKEPVLLSNIGDADLANGSGWEGYRNGSLMVFPLSDDENRVIGLVALHNKQNPPFTEQDRSLGKILASYSCKTIRLAKMSESLHQSEARFSGIVELAGEAIVSTNENQEIVLFNHNAEQVFGYSREEILGSKLNRLFPERYREDHEIHVLEFLASDDVTRRISDRREIIGIRKNGEEFPSEASVSKLHLDGELVLTALVRDISARRKTENELAQRNAELAQSQKMEAVGQLAGGVAHDFNNLLTVILGYGESLLETMQYNDAAREDLGQIVNAGQRAAELTRQLLAFGRRQILQPRVLNLSEIVIDMGKMLRRLIGEDIELVIDAESEMKMIRVDRAQLEQIVMNLAINARDAMPDGGKLIIKTANVVADSEYLKLHPTVKAGEYGVMTVCDEGSGMDEETLCRIFEPFYTTKDQGQGTGLGLSTVFGSVEQAGGQIEVLSEMNKGTIFHVHFPLAASDPLDEVKQETRPLESANGETVLIVEDEELIRKLARRILSKQGYKVLDAGTVEEAMAIERNHKGPIHLLVSDVVMPRLSGPDLAQRLQANRPDLRILFVSGYSDEIVSDHGIVEPGVAFLKKPHKSSELIAKVQQLLSV